MIVADASVVLDALADDSGRGDRARARLRGEDVRAPHVLDLEVLHALRANVQRRALAPDRAAVAVADLTQAKIIRVAHGLLLHRIWELRRNASAYDAAYLALAELLRAPVVTLDRRLSRVPGLRCDVEVLATGH